MEDKERVVAERLLVGFHASSKFRVGHAPVDISMWVDISITQCYSNIYLLVAKSG